MRNSRNTFIILYFRPSDKEYSGLSALGTKNRRRTLPSSFSEHPAETLTFGDD